jgi:NADPH-dependent ferric siderophore reductase
MSFIRSLFAPTQAEAQVLSAANVTPRVRRLVLGGPGITRWLDNAATRTPAAWVKVTPAGRASRAYTIRHIDERDASLHLDFALHGAGADSGTVSDWARLAQAGERVSIRGPRKADYRLLPDSKWLWLAADATALPAAQSILESLPAGIEVYAFFAVHDEAEHQPIHSAANAHVNWVYAPTPPKDCGPDQLPATGGLPDPRAPGQVVIAGEADWVKSWRAFWLNERRLENSRVNARAYWKRGSRGHRG